MQPRPAFAILLSLGLLTGCACGRRSTHEVDGELSGSQLTGVSDPAAPSREDCELMCKRADGGNVVEVDDCDLVIDGADEPDSGDTGAELTAHVTCTATVTFVCL